MGKKMGVKMRRKIRVEMRRKTRTRMKMRTKATMQMRLETRTRVVISGSTPSSTWPRLASWMHLEWFTMKQWERLRLSTSIRSNASLAGFEIAKAGLLLTGAGG